MMARGIDGRAVFGDEPERRDLCERFAKLVPEQGLNVYAWAIMSNHVHLLIRTGPKPLSRFMHRLLTGYSVKYNLQKDRKGHVFQGRFKSILVQEETYFRKLVRYIHRNPMKAGLVRSFEELEDYRWCGHGAITGLHVVPWQDTDHVLVSFNGCTGSSLSGYMDYISSEDHADDAELISGTYILGKYGIRKSWRSAARADWGNCCRILGDKAFALDVYSRLGQSGSWTLRDRGQVHEAIEDAFGWIEENWRLSRAAIKGKSKGPGLSDARAALAWVFHERLGLSQTEIAALLGMTRSGARNALKRADELELYHPFIQRSSIWQRPEVKSDPG